MKINNFNYKVFLNLNNFIVEYIVIESIID